MRNIIKDSAMTLAESAEGNPIIATVVVVVFYMLFNQLEAIVETLVFGDRFEHWLDPFFIAGFIAYSAYSVYACAMYNRSKTITYTGVNAEWRNW